MLNMLRTTRGRIGITVAISIVVIALWFSFDMSIAILPALLAPAWITLSASKQGEPFSTSDKRQLFFALVMGVLVLLLITGVFVIQR